MNLNRLWELVIDREAWRAAVHAVAKSQTQLSDWTELDWLNFCVGALVAKSTLTLNLGYAALTMNSNMKHPFSPRTVWCIKEFQNFYSCEGSGSKVKR